MEHLSVKRPRHRVVDKLLELGLVCSRQELRKKRARKKDGAARSPGGRGRRGSDDGSGSSSSDDEGDRIYGCQESMEWLLQSLEDALEDWDSEDPSSVPLVPILEVHHLSMENSDFCSLLRTMGIQPPADEQEAYWRIPADMTANMLSSRITVIKKALEGDYGAPLLVLGSASDNAAAAEESDSAADVDSSAEVDATLEEAGDSCMVVRGGHSPVKSARTPKNKSKYAKAMQELLQKKRAHEDG
ncbi:hypothetical protein V5799_029785, partial [Amblyomma americanum]